MHGNGFGEEAQNAHFEITFGLKSSKLDTRPITEPYPASESAEKPYWNCTVQFQLNENRDQNDLQLALIKTSVRKK